ncbi:sulfatase-like hydrolase/transferase [Pyrococcus abyssi]|nr:sulfatase-like hydrolase/transferase [Pyrococcus abyssi]
MTEYPNVIFIVIDTLRKDYAKPLEGELKKLGFISYENVIAPASWTTPSHASIFTGLYPALHGAHETKTKKDLNVKLNSRVPILSEILLEMGYNTYLFTANPYINPRFGFVGFSKVEDILFMPSGKFRRIIWHLTKNGLWKKVSASF